MRSGVLPGPFYAICSDPRPTEWDEFLRSLLHVYCDNGCHVALFRTRQRAEEWIASNEIDRPNPKPFAFTERDELAHVLMDLAARGDTHVAIDPGKPGSVGQVGAIADLLGVIRGT